MISAIETKYNGWKFRSRLEARWAMFFDEMGIAYDYEREGYEIDMGVWYLPDFYLHLDNMWVEVKHRDYDDPDAVDKMGKLVAGLKEPGVIVYGDPYDHVAVLFTPHFLKPGYVRQVANFCNLPHATPAAINARQAQFGKRAK
jgi:hypothetical protein